MGAKASINNTGNVSLKLVSETTQILSGKWKIQIITFLLQHGTTRYMQLQRWVCSISARVLSKELQDLERRDRFQDGNGHQTYFS